MRCQSCDYELWHYTGRTCPECGEDFSLKNYFFEPNTVTFHCPHCDHGIKGTAPNGLPSASIEECESCSRAVGLEMYIVRPSDEHTTHASGILLPIRSKHINWFRRYFETIWLVMTKPQFAISRVPVQEPLFIAWKFFLTTLCITLSISMIPILLSLVLMTSMGPPGSGWNAQMIIPIVMMQLVIGGLAVVLYILVWTVVTHVMLQWTGGSAFTIRRTMQSILYGGGASLANIVPCVGGFVGGIWWIVSAINMVKRGQRVSGGRASIATLAAPILCMICVCGGYTILIFSLMAPAMANAKSVMQQAQQQANQRAAQMAPTMSTESTEQSDLLILDQP